MSALRKTGPRPEVRHDRPSTLSIGAVLKQLRREFPDVTVSKLRFWESEGLVSPARTEKGYRRYSSADVQRLRYILTTQRDNYLPLKVIKQRLDAMDEGNVTPVTGLISAEQFKQENTRLTHSDVCAAAEIDDTFLTQLAKAGFVNADRSGLYCQDDVSIARTASQLVGFGLDERHLKTLRATAQRYAGVITQVSGPLGHAKSSDAKARSEETARELSALIVSLQAAFIKASLRGEFD